MSNGSDKLEKRNSVGKKWLAVFNISVLFSLLAMKLVSWGDIFFPVFASVYVYVMSRVAFPKLGAKPVVGGWKFAGAQYLPKYILLCGVIGQFLPLLQIIVAFVGDDQTTVRQSAPHLFLLCSQVLAENLTFWRDSLSLPSKAVIPVLYNAWRLLDLHKWAVAVFTRDLSSSLPFASYSWALFGRSLAVSNVLLWHFNLWCFLLPVFVPWALRAHYTGVNALRDTHVE